MKFNADGKFQTDSSNAIMLWSCFPQPPTGSPGQYLLAEPSVYYPGLGPSGQISVWNNFVPGAPAAYYNYDTSNMLSSNSFGQWSCFTFIVNLKVACNPITSAYRKGSTGTGGCSYVTNGNPSTDTADLSNSTSLFFSAQVTLLNSKSVMCAGSSTDYYLLNLLGLDG